MDRFEHRPAENVERLRDTTARAPGSVAPADAAPRYEPPDDPSAPPTLEAEQRHRLQRALGPDCQITGLLGTGGFASVYAAWDVRLRRAVAVKTLRPELSLSGAGLARFRREAQAIAQLRHPNIVPIYTVGEVEDVAYYVMPFLRGETLAQCLRRQAPLAVEDARRILMEVGGALAMAHGAGVVHRDVKPENIMLEDPDRRAVMMDFGIAKLFTADAASAYITETGEAVGTPTYMSPEQAVGESDVDHRSDQYSLAVVAYEMLTGRAPFVGQSIAVIVAQRFGAPVPSVRSLRREVPRHVSDAIECAMRCDPADRFASMADFVKALDAPPDEARSRAWLLEVRSGDLATQWHEVRAGASLLVGRDPRAEVRLPTEDRDASRQHCRVQVDEDGALVEDLGSKNGTYVNGSRVHWARLAAGDRIRCGTTRLRVHLVSRPAADTTTVSGLAPLG